MAKNNPPESVNALNNVIKLLLENGSSDGAPLSQHVPEKIERLEEENLELKRKIDTLLKPIRFLLVVVAFITPFLAAYVVVESGWASVVYAFITLLGLHFLGRGADIGGVEEFLECVSEAVSKGIQSWKKDKR